MIAFFILPFVATFVLYLNIRKVANGHKGVLIAGVPIIMAFGSFLLGRDSLFLSLVQTVMVIWLCQALWLYLLWDVVCLARVLCFRKKDNPFFEKSKFVCYGSRIILAATVFVTGIILAYGIPNHHDYKVHTLKVPLAMGATSPNSSANPKILRVVFLSDLHINPLFRQEKLERLIAQCDSIHPDFILFGGDFADIHDSTMRKEGYGELMRRLSATAKFSAVAIAGNHEAYMERSGSDPEKFLKEHGWLTLDDSTSCLPKNSPIACFSGRRDLQKAKMFDYPRKSISQLAMERDVQVSGTNTRIPWILLDHQPKGIGEQTSTLPDFAFSGHTHDGQFFPGNILIKWIWPLAYGVGTLDNVPWLVSSGIGSWGPTVRAGSDTEIWIIEFSLM